MKLNDIPFIIGKLFVDAGLIIGMFFMFCTPILFTVSICTFVVSLCIWACHPHAAWAVFLFVGFWHCLRTSVVLGIIVSIIVLKSIKFG